MKKMLLIGCGTLLLGAVIFFFAFQSVGFDFNKISSRPPLERKEKVVSSQNQSITIDDRNVPITIKQSSDGDIHFEYSENEKDYYDITENGNIRFVKKTNYRWYDHFFNFDFSQRSFVIYLPQNYSGSLDIGTTNGNIDIGNVTADNIILSSTNGRCTIENVVSKKGINADTTNHRIEVKNAAAAENCVFKTTNGKISLYSITANELRAATTNNAIDADMITAEGDITLQSTNGRIVISKLLSKADIELKTTNNSISGDITGSFSDFTISSKTTNAKNNLPENAGNGIQKLRVHTTNGKIAVDFTK